MRKRQRGVNYIRSRTEQAISGGPIPPSVIRVQDKVEKASGTSMLRGALSTHRLHDLSVVDTVRKARKEASGKVVQKYGEIYGKFSAITNPSR